MDLVQDKNDVAPGFQEELFCDANWARAITEPYGLNLRWLNDLPESSPPLPFVHWSTVAGERISCLPFSDYLPLRDPEVAARIYGRLRAEYPQAAITLKTQLPNDVELPGARISRRAVLHTITPGGPGPNGKFRANSRRAVRDGVSVRKCTDEAALRRFYVMYADLRTSKFGSIPQPYAFFHAIFQRFISQDRGYLLEAVYENRVIASFVLLTKGGKAFHKFSASSTDKLVPRPNNLIFSFLHGELASGNITSLDLGLSGLSEAYAGLRYFKTTAGGTASPITYYEWIPPEFNENAEKRFKAHLGELTAKMVSSGLSAEQLSAMSEVIYPHFA